MHEINPTQKVPNLCVQMKTKKNSKINPVANGLLLYFICVDIIHFYHLYSVLTLVALLSFVICWHQWLSVTLFSFVICCHQWLCFHWWSVAISDFVVIGDLCWYHSLYHLWSVLKSFALLSFVICVGISDFVVICDLCWHQWLCCHLWSVLISYTLIICDLCWPK